MIRHHRIVVIATEHTSIVRLKEDKREEDKDLLGKPSLFFVSSRPSFCCRSSSPDKINSLVSVPSLTASSYIHRRA